MAMGHAFAAPTAFSCACSLRLDRVSASRGRPLSAARRVRSPQPQQASPGRVRAPSRLTCRSSQVDGNTSSLVTDIDYIMTEMKGVDMALTEVYAYFERSERGPKGHPDADMKQLGATLRRIVDEGSSFDSSEIDLEQGQAIKAALLQLWGWRRRGGGMMEPTIPAHQTALRDIQGLDIETGEEVEDDSDKVQSSLLDGVDMTEEDKKELGRVFGGFAMGAVQSVLWNGILLMVFALLWLNFHG
ncbi:unnamed protein product [Pedinophyceae sp. YPF-701]|nr:unnamed protein product [Pedinophyceae sp. YPF-701]